MLNNAAAPYSGQLNRILQRAASEWAILGSFEESDFADVRILYAAAYGIIRIGNTVARHSRQLELAYPGYRWVFWVNLRNELAHQDRVDGSKIQRAVSQRLPGLIEAITGERPAPSARRARLS